MQVLRLGGLFFRTGMDTSQQAAGLRLAAARLAACTMEPTDSHFILMCVLWCPCIITTV